MRCDTIYLMDGGSVTESGSHAELMRARGRYYELWREQIPDAEPIHIEPESEAAGA
jgi:ATP-binding cassette subfamily B protein